MTPPHFRFVEMGRAGVGHVIASPPQAGVAIYENVVGFQQHDLYCHFDLFGRKILTLAKPGSFPKEILRDRLRCSLRMATSLHPNHCHSELHRSEDTVIKVKGLGNISWVIR